MKSLLKKIYKLAGKPKWAKQAYESCFMRNHNEPVLYADKTWTDTLDAWCGGFIGKKILDVGCDHSGLLIQQLSRFYNTADAVGLNLLVDEKIFSNNCRLVKGDIRKTVFPDEYFDIIVSSSAFEHIHNLENAIQEMYRLLKPGGYLYSHFGPIWSTSYGHHMWITIRNQTYNYWNVILPPYAHLLMSHNEIVQYLEGEYGSELSNIISNYVLYSDDQNQLFFEDYESIIRDSPFEIILFKGYDHSELKKKYDPFIKPDHFHKLQEKYPGKTQFFYDGITILLVKP
jgi:ubiquinone/menaquinone biosynthesis C-methylase UbiE